MADAQRKEKERAVRKVTVRFKLEEYQQLETAFKQTTKRKLSEYIRFVLLGKPVTVYTRSKSLDDFNREMILLRNELSAFGRNFNQAVKRLHSMDGIADLKAWIAAIEISRENFFRKVAEINAKIGQISTLWLQE